MVDADVLIVAGDLGDARHVEEALARLCDRAPVVVYVAGNHEYYGACPEETSERLSCAAARLANLRWLDSSVVDVAGLRFAGATLWYPGRAWAGRLLDAVTPDALFVRDLVPWVHEEAARAAAFVANADADILVTHHLPTWRSASHRLRDAPLNAYFVHDLEAHLGRFRLVVHGHTHRAMDYEIGPTRVLCHPCRTMPRILDVSPHFETVCSRLSVLPRSRRLEVGGSNGSVQQAGFEGAGRRQVGRPEALGRGPRWC
ncbi:MAG: metallophosphoesterase [Myxococcota bacterium]